MGIVVKHLVHRLPTIAAELRPKASAVVKTTLFNIEAGAKQRTPPRVDTGAMMNGWTTQITSDLSGLVTNPVAHTIHNELGTVHMTAHPMLIPSVEHERQPFQDGMKAIFG